MDPLLIGITTDYAPAEPGRDPRYFLKSSYVSYFREEGVRVVLLPFLSSDFTDDWTFLDGIVLSGSGPDIPPHFYGEEKTWLPGLWMPEERVNFELSLLRLSEREGMPLFGICGGFQTMNVLRGGTLVQDLLTERPGGLAHQESKHPVTLGPLWGRLAEREGKIRENQVLVNSFHHQGVKRLGERLEIEAVSGDNLVEGFRDPDHPFFAGVQWHPERMPEGDDFSRILRDTFLDACLKYRTGRR
ncbi:MAG: gamma-glutamyl-gamma-aminobutyrate hydrolase family protein [Nitrospirae bacterium]|nr:gamma-glutamyl-gamma-aminobutyrate hydrolase family protein [Nitrospirota bacterium]MCL5285540.1 gamma-glutamyl-gamma-aminobutyrate hydrolase family protein [Nitrospirota bacterium]